MTRLVIVCMLGGQAAKVINSLRKKYDEESATAIDAHVTLAGLCDTDLTVKKISKIISQIASNTSPFKLTITGVDTFLPISATSFIQIEPKEKLIILHDKLITQLNWQEPFPYKSHVTITEYLTTEKTMNVVDQLRTMKIHETDIFDTISLLQKNNEGRWKPLLKFHVGNVDWRIVNV